MTLARVIGTVTSTVKHPKYFAHKLMVVQPISPTGEPIDSGTLAVDTVQAGVGDWVLVMREGTGVRQILQDNTAVPIRSMIVGIVDQVHLG